MNEVTESKDLPNTVIIAEFNASLKPVLEKEKELWVRMLGHMREETLSVRGVKATLEVVNSESGSLPTIAISTVQYFQSAGDVFDKYEEAKKVSLSVLLNVVIQGTRKTGKKKFLELLDESDTFANLKKTISNLPDKKKVISVKLVGVDNILKALQEAMEAENFSGILVNPDMAEAVAKQLSACARQSRSVNHPSIRAKIA